MDKFRNPIKHNHDTVVQTPEVSGIKIAGYGLILGGLATLAEARLGALGLPANYETGVAFITAGLTTLNVREVLISTSKHKDTNE